VIRASDDHPIKFDALIGDGILREQASGSDGLLSAYTAVPIQAHSALANNALIRLEAGPTELPFDGLSGHYKAVTGKIRGNVWFDRLMGTPSLRQRPLPAHAGCEL
jgi:hypothetical protein